MTNIARNRARILAFDNTSAVVVKSNGSEVRLELLTSAAAAQLEVRPGLVVYINDEIVLDSRPKLEEGVDYPSVDELLHHLDRHMAALRDTLERRGRAYGEEVLAKRGELGMLEHIFVKAERAKHASTEASQDWPADSYLDIAGYALLILAMRDWKQNRNAK